ncbi:MAG: hypothetical protein ACJ8E5_06850 [Xanthobacteraceae bacterium]
MQKVHTVSGLRNSGEAYRQFRPTGFVAGAHRRVLDLMRHKFSGAVIALIGIAGIAGTFITFWPR